MRSARRTRGSGGTAKRPTKTLAAVAALVLLFGIIPIWQYADAVTVPGGVTAQQAEVVSVDRTGGTRPNRSNRSRGRVATVLMPDETEETVYLGYRWDYPETGDDLTVYLEDDDLRTTAEVSWLALAGGLLAVLILPASTIGWLLHRRRTKRPFSPPDRS